jgi:hypothetical protein
MAGGPGAIRSPLPVPQGLHRVGVIRAGVKKSKMRDGELVTFPSATEHFVVNADLSTSQQSADSFHQKYGETPSELDIVLPAATPEEVLDSAWRLYGGSQLKRKCEGPGGQCSVRSDGGTWIDGPCACDREGIPVESKKHCQARWVLSFLLMDVTGLGVWQFGTGSPIAADNFTKVLNTLMMMQGTLLQQACILRLVPRTVNPEGRPKTVYVGAIEAVDITPRQAIEGATALAGGSLGELPPPVLDEGPDPLLDARKEEEHDVVDVQLPLPSVADQIRALGRDDRANLYRLAGITPGTAAPDVEGLLWAKWGELELLDVEYLDVGFLYAELIGRAGDE